MNKELREKLKDIKYPGTSLIFCCNYYVADGIVFKSYLTDSMETTLEDLKKANIIQPENKVIIQEGNHLNCYFPNSEREKVEYYLDTYSVPRGFSYTLHTCDTLYNADKEVK